MSSCCIAVDLGGTQLRVAQVGDDGAIHWQSSVPTINEGNPAQVIEQISQLIAEQAHATPVGIAVAAPGPLDTRSGVVRRIPTLKGWENVDLCHLLTSRFDYPVVIENDAIAATVGQWRFGAGRGVNNLLYLTISTGIGGGMISGGQVIRGHRGFAGHVGHLLLYPESSVRCACGRYGCFEAYASGSALDAKARNLANVGSEACQKLWAEVMGEAATLSDMPATQAAATHLANAAARGHQPSLAIWQEQGALLAQGISTLVHAMDPERVVLGGSVSKSYRWFATSLHEQLEQRLMHEFASVQVKPAEQLEDAGLLGVASLLFDSLQAGKSAR